MNYISISDFGAFVRGIFKDETTRFEREFIRYVGVKYALATSFGRTALYVLLKAIDVVGKEVIIPAFTCSVVRKTICLAGAKPIFVDINSDTLNMNIPDIKRRLTNKTRAIIPTHYYGGICSNIEEIVKLGRENNFVVIEDCALSLGAEYKGKKAGSFGDAAIFSLTKNMLNFGGGFLVTNHKNLYEKAKQILRSEPENSRLKYILDFYKMIEYGYVRIVDAVIFDRIGHSIFKWWLRDFPRIFPNSLLNMLKLIRKKFIKNKKVTFYETEERDNSSNNQVSLNLSMCPIIAAVGRSQLKKLDCLIEKRIAIGEKLKIELQQIYKDCSGGTEQIKNVHTNFPMQFPKHNIWNIRKICKKQGLLLRPSWPAFQEWCEEQDTPGVREIRDTLLMWDVNPMVTSKEIKSIVTIILNAVDIDK